MKFDEDNVILIEVQARQLFPDFSYLWSVLSVMMSTMPLFTRLQAEVKLLMQVMMLMTRKLTMIVTMIVIIIVILMVMVTS